MHTMNEVLQLLLDVDNGLMGWRCELMCVCVCLFEKEKES